MEFKTFNQLKKNLSKDSTNLPQVRVAVLGDSALELFCQAIRGYGVEVGLHIEVLLFQYNEIESQVFNNSSELYLFYPDFVCFLFSNKEMTSKFCQTEPAGREWFADKEISRFFILTEHVSAKSNAKVIATNHFCDFPIFGNYAGKVTTSMEYQMAKLNVKLMELSQQQSNVFLCDLNALVLRHGLSFVFPPEIYAGTDMVYSLDFLPVLAKNFIDIIQSIRGQIIKCVIMDLDNTLWGGIIGDDGMENIELGNLGNGKVFTEVQYWLKELKNRGIILAVCSKNDEKTAKEPFEKHPDMVLRLNDIAVFVANWKNKADNIRYIQKVVNLDFNSMVLIDDNPFERELVARLIPEISIPDLPDDPAMYLSYLFTLNLFETASFSENDSVRTEQYRVDADRTIARQQFTDVKEFLSSLEMTCVVERLNTFNLPRVAQLSQRSNQFNLRTVRYTEQDLVALQKEENREVYTFTLSDKFGDSGIISAIALKRNADVLFIENWVMSCRVLGRDMEQFVINFIVALGLSKGATTIAGEYIPSSKNGIVSHLFNSLGFTQGKDGLWGLDTKTYVPKNTAISNAGR